MQGGCMEEMDILSLTLQQNWSETRKDSFLLMGLIWSSTAYDFCNLSHKWWWDIYLPSNIIQTPIVQDKPSESSVLLHRKGENPQSLRIRTTFRASSDHNLLLLGNMSFTQPVYNPLPYTFLVGDDFHCDIPAWHGEVMSCILLKEWWREKLSRRKTGETSSSSAANPLFSSSSPAFRGKFSICSSSLHQEEGVPPPLF